MTIPKRLASSTMTLHYQAKDAWHLPVRSAVVGVTEHVRACYG